MKGENKLDSVIRSIYADWNAKDILEAADEEQDGDGS